MLAYRNPDRKKYKALDHRTIRCTIESYGDTVQVQVLYLGDAVAGCGVHVPRLGQLQLSPIHSPSTRRGRVHMLRNPHAAYAASRSLSLCTNQI